MTFPVFFSLIFILLLTPHPHPTIATNHLCEIITAGSFNSNLISITWHTSETLHFYFRLPTRYIAIGQKLITRRGIDLSSNPIWEEADWSGRIYTKWGVPREENLGAYYEFLVESSSSLKVESQGGLVLSDSLHRMYNLRNDRLLWSQTAAGWMTVIYEQYMYRGWVAWRDQVFGYVVTHDNVEMTGDLIIYQLILQSNDLKMWTELDADHRHFYYLDGSIPNRLTLVHRHSRRKDQVLAPPFKKLVGSFIYDGIMHLFDDEVGCVYLVTLGGRIDLQKQFESPAQKKLMYKKVGLPYEKYFKCPASFVPDVGLDPARCGEDGPDDDETTEYFGTGLTITLIVISCLVLVLAIIGVLYFGLKKGQPVVDPGSGVKSKSFKKSKSNISQAVISSVISEGNQQASFVPEVVKSSASASVDSGAATEDNRVSSSTTTNSDVRIDSILIPKTISATGGGKPGKRGHKKKTPPGNGRSQQKKNKTPKDVTFSRQFSTGGKVQGKKKKKASKGSKVSLIQLSKSPAGHISSNSTTLATSKICGGRGGGGPGTNSRLF